MTFKRTTLEETLAVSPLLVLDGAMSTPLENMGIDLNTKLWTAKVLADQPEMVKQVHKNYFKAGADCGITCSYQATVPGLMDIGYTKEQAEEQLEIFRRIYSKVRLLSAEELKEENTTQAGKGENYWKESCLGAGKYCDDCVSVVALKEKTRKTKLKYIDTELYEVTAQYVEVDGQSCVLEMIQNLGNGADIAQSD